MKRTGILAFLVLIVLVGAVLFFWKSTAQPSIQQPIAYNHKRHISEGLACKDCHKSALTGEAAGRPNEQTCRDCHDPGELEEGTEGKNPEIVKLLTYLKEKASIPWRRIFQLPEHVYFSHVRHVTTAKVACETCHGAMAEAVRPPVAPLVAITMDFCINCHVQQRSARAGAAVTRDCNACHK